MRVEKAILAPGTYFTPDGPVTFSDRDIYQFAATTQQMLKDGLSIPLPLEHQSNAKAQTHAERLAHSVAYNTGFLAGVKVKDGVLYGDLDVHWLPGAKSDEDIKFRLEKTVRFTSPELYPRFTSGDGKTYTHALTHLCLTPQPVWHKQPPFGSATVALSRARHFSAAPMGAAPLRLSLRDLWCTGNCRAAKAIDWGDWTDPADMAIHRAPKGGLAVAGIFFPGGRFIPGPVLAQASPDELAQVEAATEARRDKLRADVGDTSRDQLRDKLLDHRGLEMKPHQVSSTRRAYASLKNYHGDLALHRLHQMVHKDLEKHERASGPQKDFLARRLRAYNHMLDWHQRDEEAGKAAFKASKTGVHVISPKGIHADPERFQYKVNTNKEGIAVGGGAGAGVKKFNPDFAGILHVWHDPDDGKDYVINGHHRLYLAKKHDAPEVVVRYLDAKTAAEARTRGALINIAEGHGTAIDAAKFLRDTGSTLDDLAGHGVSVKGQIAKDAAALSGLAGPIFQKLTTGKLDQKRALSIAQIKDHESQMQFHDYLERPEIRKKELPDYVIDEMAKEANETPTVAGKEGGLFGNDEGHNVFLERNTLKAAVKRRLATERNLFGAVGTTNKTGELERRAKNKLDPEENRKIAEQAEQHRNLFDQEVNLRGNLRDLVDHHAEELYRAKSAKQRKAVEDQLYETVRSHISRSLAGGAGGGLPGSAAGAAGAGGMGPEAGLPVGAGGRSGLNGSDIAANSPGGGTVPAGAGAAAPGGHAPVPGNDVSRLVTREEIDARRGAGPARQAPEARAAWTRGIEPQAGPVRPEQQHQGGKEKLMRKPAKYVRYHKSAELNRRPEETHYGSIGDERQRRAGDVQPMPTGRDLDFAIDDAAGEVEKKRRSAAAAAASIPKRPKSHGRITSNAQQVQSAMADESLHQAQAKLDDLREARRLEVAPMGAEPARPAPVEQPRPETMPSAAHVTKPGNIDVGSTVKWNSKTGPVDAEYRGKTMGMDGWEATVIVRPADAPPYQITVPLAQIDQPAKYKHASDGDLQSMVLHQQDKEAKNELIRRGYFGQEIEKKFKGMRDDGLIQMAGKGNVAAVAELKRRAKVADAKMSDPNELIKSQETSGAFTKRLLADLEKKTG